MIIKVCGMREPENDDFVALPQQSTDKMGTDEARSARYENTHETSPGMPHG